MPAVALGAGGGGRRGWQSRGPQMSSPSSGTCGRDGVTWLCGGTGGTPGTNRALQSRGPFPAVVRGRCERGRRLRDMLTAEEGAPSQGPVLPEPPEGPAPPTPGFSPMRPLRLPTSRTVSKSVWGSPACSPSRPCRWRPVGVRLCSGHGGLRIRDPALKDDRPQGPEHGRPWRPRPCLPCLESGHTSLGPHPPGPGSQGTKHSGHLGPTVFWTTWDEWS